MKNFKLEVPEGTTLCLCCPFNHYTDKEKTTKLDICQYLCENDICEKYDFTKMHLWDLNDYNRQALESENTEFDYGHNIKHYDTHI